MALFRRKKQDGSVLPTEVQEYYQAERRDRTGVAWALAILTFLITVAIIIGLFFGGRWVYRKVFDNDKPNTAQQTEQNQPDENKQGVSSENQSSGSTSGSTGTSSTNTGASSQTGSPTPAASMPRPSTTPTTGTLPNTGPSEDL